VRNEIAALHLISHPNVLQLKDIVEAKLPTMNSTRDTKTTIMVLDYCSGGELFDIMLHTGGFSEVIARTYFMQIASAISTCHAAGIYHRDIKPQNILLDSDFQIKIADFGISALHFEGKDICDTYCGTPSYMAPEILAGQSYSGSKADSWSLGVLLFVMLAGNPPLRTACGDDWWFKAISTRRMEKFWHAHERISPSFSHSSRTIINRLLVADPKARSSVEDIMTDPWMKGNLVRPESLKHHMSKRLDITKINQRSAELKRFRDHEAKLIRIGGKLNFRNPEKILGSNPASSSEKKSLKRGQEFKGGFIKGFYILEPPSMTVLYNVQDACTKSGAKRVCKKDAWSFSTLFSIHGTEIEFILNLFSVVIDGNTITFVNVNSMVCPSFEVNRIVELLTSIVPSALMHI
jgi:serine/threonine protein kinase